MIDRLLAMLLLAACVAVPANEIHSSITDAEALQMFKTSLEENTAGFPGVIWCQSTVLSPRAGELWTATYLLVEWQTCPRDDGDVSQVNRT